MTTNDREEGAADAPFLQKLYDRPFVLLGLGLAVMLAFYTIWGWVELAQMPVSNLP